MKNEESALYASLLLVPSEIEMLSKHSALRLEKEPPKQRILASFHLLAKNKPSPKQVS